MRLTKHEAAFCQLWHAEQHKFRFLREFCEALGVSEVWASKTLSKEKELNEIQRGMESSHVPISIKRARGYRTMAGDAF